ncbi:vascular endothelial growth factor receptor 1-like [Anopheles aquasalis]|uniref:vascular endothelial growth factor receptor 1-like n=1 Tax=Anopheles aquasalis TaxID=42839 RepID=UPI00215A8713|nr:vascular endothelial growth factor receptor 1-like [Anopheles aquasalis]
MEGTVILVAIGLMVIGAFDQIALVRAQNSSIGKDAEGAVDLPQIDWPADEIVLGYRDTWNVTCKCHKPIVWKPFDYEYKWDPPTIAVSIYNTTDLNMPFGSMLTITNASALMVGRYYCVHSVKEQEDLDEMLAEDVASSIYVYVDDPYQLMVPDAPVQFFNNKEEIVVVCKPSHPDVDLQLCDQITQHCLATSEPTKWFSLPYRNYETFAKFYCKANGISHLVHPVEISKNQLLKPTIVSNVGDIVPLSKTIRLSCSLELPVDINIQISWKTLPNYQPAEIDKTISVGGQITIVHHNVPPSSIYKRDLIIENATLSHQRTYRCEVLDDKNNTSYHNFRLQVRETPDDFVILREAQSREVIHRRINGNGEIMPIEIMVRYNSYPTNIAFVWSREIIGNIEENCNLILRRQLTENHIKLRINQPTVYDTDNYTLLVVAGTTHAVYNISIIVYDKPSLNMHNLMAVKGETVDFLCASVAYPSPEMWFFFQPCNEVPWGNCSMETDTETKWHAGTQEKNSLIRSKITYEHVADKPGIIYCKANNSEGTSIMQSYLLLRNVSNLMTLEIAQPKDSITVGDNVTIICSTIIVDDDDVDITFNHNGKIQESTVIYKDSNIQRKQLTLLNVGLHHTGDIDCYVSYRHVKGRNNKRSININVIEPIAPHLRSGKINQTLTVDVLKPLQLDCDVIGVPEPTISWFINGQPFAYNKNNSTNTTSIFIPYTNPMHSGLYECIAENKKGFIKIVKIVTSKRTVNRKVWNQPFLYAAVVFLILTTVFAFISLFFYKKMKRVIRNSNLLSGYVQMRPILEPSEE